MSRAARRAYRALLVVQECCERGLAAPARMGHINPNGPRLRAWRSVRDYLFQSMTDRDHWVMGTSFMACLQRFRECYPEEAPRLFAYRGERPDMQRFDPLVHLDPPPHFGRAEQGGRTTFRPPHEQTFHARRRFLRSDVPLPG